MVAEHTGTSPLADVPSSIPLALEKRAGSVPIDERGGPCHRAMAVIIRAKVCARVSLDPKSRLKK
jgi:hypothetical protein